MAETPEVKSSAKYYVDHNVHYHAVKGTQGIVIGKGEPLPIDCPAEIVKNFLSRGLIITAEEKAKRDKAIAEQNAKKEIKR